MNLYFVLTMLAPFMDCHGIRPTDTIFVYVDGSEQ